MDEHEGGASFFKCVCNNVYVHASPDVRSKDVESKIPSESFFLCYVVNVGSWLRHDANG